MILNYTESIRTMSGIPQTYASIVSRIVLILLNILCILPFYKKLRQILPQNNIFFNWILLFPNIINNFVKCCLLTNSVNLYIIVENKGVLQIKQDAFSLLLRYYPEDIIGRDCLKMQRRRWQRKLSGKRTGYGRNSGELCRYSTEEAISKQRDEEYWGWFAWGESFRFLTEA